MCTTTTGILGARRLAPPNNYAYALHEIYDDDQQHESHDHDAHHPADADAAPIISTLYHDIDADPIEMSDDTAGLMVMLYLLFISTLFISTLIGGLFIVIQYGFVVLVAVVVVVFCMFVVAAVVMNAVAQEKTLMRAKTKINRCVQCARMMMCQRAE